MQVTNEMIHQVSQAYNAAFLNGAGSSAFNIADGTALNIVYKYYGMKQTSQSIRMLMRSKATSLRRRAIGQ